MIHRGTLSDPTDILYIKGFWLIKHLCTYSNGLSLANNNDYSGIFYYSTNYTLHKFRGANPPSYEKNKM
jgi:hypothetical protein